MRDLGGLPTKDGRTTRAGAMVRSEHLVHLTPAGWQSLLDHGVRTIVDLRTTAEAARDRQTPVDGVDVLAVPLEDGLDDDPEFRGWAESGVLATPLYYRRFLERWPSRCADAVSAVATARPGGVLVHCSKGCDRTGMLAMFVLALCDVTEDAIVDDHAATAARQCLPRAGALGREDDEAAITRVVRREGCADVPDATRRALRETDVAGGLSGGGLAPAAAEALRRRLVGP